MSVYLQYENYPNINNLLAGLTPFLLISSDDFYTDFFDLDICDTNGLENWGRILNQSRTINSISIVDIFGFGSSHKNFDNGVFFTDTTVPQDLDDDGYRVLLKFKYFSYVIDNSLESASLAVNSYVKGLDDNYTVTITEDGTSPLFNYHFSYTLQDFEITLFKFVKILPRAAGTDYTVTWS